MKQYPTRFGINVLPGWFMAALIALTVFSVPSMAADRTVLCEAFLLCGV